MAEAEAAAEVVAEAAAWTAPPLQEEAAAPEGASWRPYGETQWRPLSDAVDGGGGFYPPAQVGFEGEPSPLPEPTLATADEPFEPTEPLPASVAEMEDATYDAPPADAPPTAAPALANGGGPRKDSPAIDDLADGLDDLFTAAVATEPTAAPRPRPHPHRRPRRRARSGGVWRIVRRGPRRRRRRWRAGRSVVGVAADRRRWPPEEEGSCAAAGDTSGGATRVGVSSYLDSAQAAADGVRPLR